ncbi:MAG: energy transducer TonB [Gemmatimonadaceae bacterium]|nr:energy transducer TonB [Gemmatimonadaceae bacterium]
MFNNLLESKAQKQKSLGGSIGSIVMHVLIIWGALTATANAGAKSDEDKEQKIDFVEVKKDEPPPPKEEPPPPQEVAVQQVAKGFQVLSAPVNIPDVLPEIDLSKNLTNESDFTGKGVAGGRGNGVVGAPPEKGDQPYFEFQVEKPVAQIPGSGQPRYPDILKSAGVEGEVLAQFTVDTTGRVELPSFTVLKKTHDLFVTSVRQALPAMRFLPAEAGGRKVRQLVQQPFVFAIQK